MFLKGSIVESLRLIESKSILSGKPSCERTQCVCSKLQTPAFSDWIQLTINLGKVIQLSD